MKVILDRFEGEFAIVELEDGLMVDMPKILLPDNAKEGCIIEIICDFEETEDRRKKIKSKMNSLFCKE